MFNRFRYSLLLALTIFIALGAAAQSAAPDYVCTGSTKHYWVDSRYGSSYTWKIDEEVLSTNSNEINYTWDKPPGKYVLTVQELSETGCPGSIQTIEVTVESCTFTKPPPITECVEPLRSAVYNKATHEVVIDQPDYFIFTPPDTRLDVTGMDISCGSDCPLTLHWRIDFSSPNPPLASGTGQPSTYTGPIQFPGDGVNYQDQVYTITYWIEDSAGNKSNEQQQTITIRPRPKIL